MAKYFAIGIVFSTALRLAATTWWVGPGRPYAYPSAVSALVETGDTIYIEAGVYADDVAVWRADSLYIAGIGGMVELSSGGQAAEGKAIWVIKGDAYRIAYIAFSQCRVPDHNGAGIRLEGTDLYLQHCRFYDNEMGILVGNNSLSRVVIEHCVFYDNGFGQGYTHHIYVNHIRRLDVRYSYLYRVRVGHHIKSRAAQTWILYNRIADETGNGSRLVDLPNGGLAVLVGNELIQGPHAENYNLVGFGHEGYATGRMHRLYLVHNTLISKRRNALFVDVRPGGEAYIVNNAFGGKGKLWNGHVVYHAANMHRAVIDSLYFVDYSADDYHLTPISPLVDAGTRRYVLPDSTRVDKEYRHPADFVPRPWSEMDSVDIGAHAYRMATAVKRASSRCDMRVFLSGEIVRVESPVVLDDLHLYTLIGQKVPIVRIDDRRWKVSAPICEGTMYLAIGQRDKEMVTAKVVRFY